MNAKKLEKIIVKIDKDKEELKKVNNKIEKNDCVGSQEKMDQDRRHQQEVESQMRQEAQDREKIARDVKMIGYDIYNKTR